jgi:hypothetical protein
MSLIEAIAQRMGWRFKDDKAFDVPSDSVRHRYSDRIEYLRSLRGKGISLDEINADDRLQYLLNK